MKLDIEKLKTLAHRLKSKYPKDIHIQQRGIGDILEGIIIDEARKYDNFLEPTGKKSTGDFGFILNNKEILVDVKTNNSGAKISMPNLISMKKLTKILKNDEELYYMFISYKDKKDEIEVKDKKIISVYDLDVSKLGIGALGYGQLQIKNYIKDKNNLTKNQTKEKFKQDIFTLYKNFIRKQKEKWRIVENSFE